MQQFQMQPYENKAARFRTQNGHDFLVRTPRFIVDTKDGARIPLCEVGSGGGFHPAPGLPGYVGIEADPYSLDVLAVFPANGFAPKPEPTGVLLSKEYEISELRSSIRNIERRIDLETERLMKNQLRLQALVGKG